MSSAQIWISMILLSSLIVLSYQGPVYEANANGVVKGSIDAIWAKIGRFDQIEWWGVPVRYEGRRGIGQIRYQQPGGGITLRDVQIVQERYAYGYTASGFPGMKNITARYEVKETGGSVQLVWTGTFKVLIPGTQGAMRAIIQRAWSGIIEKAQKISE